MARKRAVHSAAFKAKVALAAVKELRTVGELALEEALAWGRPEIFNTDQGAQYTSEAFTGRLAEAGIAISMDGRGRALSAVQPIVLRS